MNYENANCTLPMKTWIIYAKKGTNDTKSKEKTVRNIRMILDEYQKYARLTDYEMEVFPLLYDLANAMGILQISYLSSLGETTDEDMFCEQKGLEFSDGDFWRAVLSS